MIILPAIDIKEGKCVRLQQGQFDKVDIYSDNPAEIALKWEQKGAEIIHIVDLDGALHGRAVNRDTIRDIIGTINIPVQLGGGIRTMQDIESTLNDGISRVILGTSAVKEKGFVEAALKSYGEKSLDGRKFVKNDEVRDNFQQTEAYSALFMELATNADAAAEFVNGIIPKLPEDRNKKQQ